MHEWMSNAACLGKWDLMFSEDAEGKGKNSSGRPRADGTGQAAVRLQQQRALCASCPVLLECRAHVLGLPFNEASGFQAGMTPQERIRERRRLGKTVRGFPSPVFTSSRKDKSGIPSVASN